MTDTDYSKPKIGIIGTLALAGITALASYAGLYGYREQQRETKTVKSHSTICEQDVIRYKVTYTDGTGVETTRMYGDLGNLERKVRKYVGHAHQGVMLPGEVWEVDGNNHPLRVIKEVPISE